MPKTKLLPLFDATQSLRTKYTFHDDHHEDASIFVGAHHKHAKLFAAYDGMQNVVAEKNSKSVKRIGKYNFATACITYLYAEESPSEGNLGEEIMLSTVALTAQDETRVIAPKDMYTDTYQAKKVTHTKSLRDKLFITHLQDRISSFEAIRKRLDYTSTVVDTVDALNDKIIHPMFHETFHHSEQAQMHALSCKQGIAAITNSLESLNAKYLYGMVLDIYTNRLLCPNCNAGLHGMQCSHEKGFLANLKKSLNKADIETREHGELMLSTRVSASPAADNTSANELFNLLDDTGVVHKYNPDEENRIYQTRIKDIKVKTIIKEKGYDLSTFPGTIFSSSPLNLKKVQKEIAVDEFESLPSLSLEK